MTLEFGDFKSNAFDAEACPRSVVETLAPLFLAKLLQRAFVQPVLWRPWGETRGICQESMQAKAKQNPDLKVEQVLCLCEWNPCI